MPTRAASVSNWSLSWNRLGNKEVVAMLTRCVCGSWEPKSESVDSMAKVLSFKEEEEVDDAFAVVDLAGPVFRQ